MSQILYLPEFIEQVSQVVFLAYFTVLGFFILNKENITKLISTRVLCTSMTYRVSSSFDRFTAYYNCMRKTVTNLIFP